MVLLIRVVNGLIKIGRKAVIEESRQWKPAVAYCRYADDFGIIVKGTKQEAEAVRDQCREFLEGKLRLTMNMEKPILLMSMMALFFWVTGSFESVVRKATCAWSREFRWIRPRRLPIH
jgi:hypothetical protein